MGLLLLDGPTIPTATRPAGAYAQMLQALLPPGKVWRLVGSVLEELLLGCAEELARVDQRTADLLTEAGPATALELLPEFEAELGLGSSGSIEERRARVVAQTIRRQGFRPADFQAALASLFAQDAEDVVVLERTVAFCSSIRDQREIYRFFLYRDPTLSGVYYIASAQVLITSMAPAHTRGYAIESVRMGCDDPFSLCDRDLLATIPSFVSAAVPVTTRGTSLTLATPSNTQREDVIIAFIWTNNFANAALDTSALPSGWSVMSVLETAGQRVLLLRRVATNSEPTSHAFACTSNPPSGAYITGICIAYRGLDAISPVVASGASNIGGSTSAVAPSLTLTRTNDLYLGFAFAADNTAIAIAPPGTMQRVNQMATQDGFSRCVVFDLEPGAAVATGAKTTTFNHSVGGVAAAYVLRARPVSVI